MIDPRKLGQLLLGEWNKTEQPLKERGSVLPIGEYEDGSVGLAWPALLNTPYEALRNFGSHGYGEDAVPYNARQAFDAAGLAMTGGIGAGLVGGFADNAVGSAGGRLPTPNKFVPGRETYDLGNAPKVEYVDPHELLFREADQNNIAAVRKLFPDGFHPIVTSHSADGTSIIDGHNRARVAMERGVKIPSISIPFDKYESAIASGFDASDISYAVLDRLGFSDAARGISDKFPGVRFWENDEAIGPLWANAPSSASVPLAMNALERAQPQGIRAYHGTATTDPITQFRSGMKGDSPHMEHDVPAIFFSTNPKVADEYAASTGRELANRLSQDWRAAGKSEDEIAQLFDQRTPGELNATWRGYIDKALSALPQDAARVLRPAAERYRLDLDSIAQEFGPDAADTVRRNLDLARAVSDYYPDYSAVYPVDVGGNLKDVDAKIFGGQFNAIVYDNLLKEAKEQGFDGLQLRNVIDSPYGTELESDVLAMFNPGHVRSATTGDLLYSNAPTGAAVPLAMQAQQDTDINPALLEYLRLTGLY